MRREADRREVNKVPKWTLSKIAAVIGIITGCITIVVMSAPAFEAVTDLFPNDDTVTSSSTTTYTETTIIKSDEIDDEEIQNLLNMARELLERNE